MFIWNLRRPSASGVKRDVNSIARWRAIAVTQGFGHPQLQALREKTSYAGLRRAGFPEE
jgi:hypothetical protein